MPAIERLLETALYVENVERSARFYGDVFGLQPVGEAVSDAGDRVLHPLELPGGQVLLLFRKGSCKKTAVMQGGTIPPHDGSGRLHLAFAVNAADLQGWRDRLQSLGIPIEGETIWPRGGTSIYFRDPDGHLVELATPGIWSIY